MSTTRRQGSRICPPVTTAMSRWLTYPAPEHATPPRTMELDAEQSIKLALCTQDIAARWGGLPITTTSKRLAPPAHQRASVRVRLGIRSGWIKAGEHEGKRARTNPQACLLVIHSNTKAFSR
ncbi:hypothetical protein PSPO01_04993 [Paraphaeosphaeria sporulosa]